MMFKRYKINVSMIAPAAMALLLLAGAASCGGKQKSEESAAEIEAAQIEGREAARIFVNRPWRDTMELQSHLLEVRAQQSKYQVAGKAESAAAFDSAFVATLRTVRPEIARELENAERNLKSNSLK